MSTSGNDTHATRDLVLLLIAGAAAGMWWCYTHLGEVATIAIGVAAAAIVITIALMWDSRRGRKKSGVSRAEVSREVGTLALRTRAQYARPSVSARRAPLTELGIRLGRDVDSRAECWASVEDSLMVVGPPRSGKTRWLRPTIESFPGAVVATSTRPELAILTSAARLEGGRRGWVFAPQAPDESPAPGLEPLRWHPASGCETPIVAIQRAGALLSASGGFGGATDSSYWEEQASLVLRCYLHALALDPGRPAKELLRWARSPQHSTPVQILRHSPTASEWADDLESTGNTGKTSESIWTGVRGALACLADPRVAEACSPKEGQGFSARELLLSGGTLYLWGSAGGQTAVAPLISALVDAIASEAREIARTLPHGRLDPPLLLALDEAANIAPLPNLPILLSDGGGSGIMTAIVLQSLNQARNRWGESNYSAMWDASTVKMILPGLGHVGDLESIARLGGELEVASESRSSGTSGSSTTTSPMWRPRWTPEAIRGLPLGHGLVLARRTLPIEIEVGN